MEAEQRTGANRVLKNQTKLHEGERTAFRPLRLSQPPQPSSCSPLLTPLLPQPSSPALLKHIARTLPGFASVYCVAKGAVASPTSSSCGPQGAWLRARLRSEWGLPRSQSWGGNLQPPGPESHKSVDSAAGLGVAGFAGPLAVGVKGWAEGLWKLGHRE